MGTSRANQAAQPQAQVVRARSERQAQAADQAEKAGVRIAWQERLGTPLSVRAPDLSKSTGFTGGKGLTLKGGGAYREDAVAVLDTVATLYGITDAASEFAVKKVETDTKGFHHVRLTQTHRGLRVVGGELIVHFNKDDAAYEVNGQYVADIGVDVRPALKAKDAIQAAQADLTGKGFPEGKLESRPELVVYARGAEPRLAYELTLAYGAGQPEVGRWRYWIDAELGVVLSCFNDVKKINPPTTSGAHATVSGNILAGEGGGLKTVEAWQESTGIYYLNNQNVNWLVYNAAEAGFPDADTFAHRPTPDWGASDRVEMSAAYGFDVIQRYWKERHGRESFGDNGEVAIVNVHYGTKYVNAFWSPDEQQFSIGDGDGANANSLAVLDILAHEFTHAVTEHTCNLIYQDESGALNESFSDIFGTCVEFYSQPDDQASYPDSHAGQADWLCGEDCWLVSPALRDLRNPANTETVGEGGEQPSKYKGTYWYDGEGDNGGVHQNSGVQNFFFYLLCEGGSGTNDGCVYNMTGIGIRNAEQVAYRTQSVYCTPDTDYRAVREAWASAAEDLNPDWVNPVKVAWNIAFGIPPPSITAANPLPAGRVGTPYSYRMTVVNGLPPYSWELLAGELPANITFDDGLISGMPEVDGTFALTVVVTDDAGQAATNQCSLTILPVHAAPFTETFESGGLMPIGWMQQTVTNRVLWKFGAGSLKETHPAGAHGGGYNAYLATTVTNVAVTRLISPRIDFGPERRGGRLTFWHFMEEFVGEQDQLRIYYKTSYEGAWTKLATYTSSISQWRQQTVELPDPSRTYYIAFEGTARHGYGICIDDVYVYDPIPPLGIANGTVLPEAVKEAAYTNALVGVGGTAPYTFALASGSLPAGLELSAEGVISGVAAETGTSEFSVTLRDDAGIEITKAFSLAVVLPKVYLLSESFEHGGFMPAGWTQEYVTNAITWRAQSGGGDGSNFHQPDGAHSGGFNACLFATPDPRTNNVTRLITPVINLGAAPAGTRVTFWHCMTVMDRDTGPLADQDELRVYYRTSAAGAWSLLAAYTNDVSVWTQRSLPLPNPTSTYYLSFEGNAKFGHGVCIDDVQISDDSSSPLITAPGALPNAFVGVVYTYTLEAVGGVAPYAWSVVSSGLPAGLTLNGDSGVISGTPAQTELKTFGVRVTGADGHASTNFFTLKVNQVQGFPYTETFEKDGSLPTGWTQEKKLGNASWVFRSGSPKGTPAAAHGGQYNACLYYEDNSSFHITKLVSPMLNLGVGTPNTRLSFWMCMAPYSSGVWQDQMRVYYKSSPTAGWNEIANFTKAVTSWTNIVLSLPNPSTNYYIAFEGWAHFGQGVCVDDVQVTGDLSPYGSWKSRWFTEEELTHGLVTKDEDDPDFDRIVNGLEYAMGLNPRVPDTTGTPVGGVKDGHLFLTYRESMEATDVRFEVVGCTDLLAPAWSTNGVSEIGRFDTNTWRQVTARHNVSVTNAPQRFMRLRVYMP